jgi:hypothetical protein
MKTSLSHVSKLLISDLPRLDPITVLLEDLGPNQGKMIVECYGRSWSAYWGSMGGTLVQFLKSVSTDYVARKMFHGQTEIYDPDGLEQMLRKKVLELRRRLDIGQCHARDLWTDIDGLDFEHPYYIRNDLMVELIGDDWHVCLPDKPHPDFVYLVRVIDAVRAGVAQAFSEK